MHKNYNNKINEQNKTYMRIKHNKKINLKSYLFSQ